MKTLHIIFAACRRMPAGIQCFSLTSLLLMLFLPGAILPIGKRFVQGDRVSFEEFWQRGGGIIFMMVGVVGAVLFYGFVMARPWVRHLAVVLGWASVVATFVGWQGFTTEVAFSFVMLGCFPTWYLYFRRPVQVYFGVAHRNVVKGRL